jgi:hypothetical protein
VLFAMYGEGLSHDKPHRKSARVVGQVLGRFHPHGDAPVYDTLVRMAQDFSLRYPLIDGQGNFGSIDGDPPAAMRYTEVRMARIAAEMLADIEKETVDFVPNYDGSDGADRPSRGAAEPPGQRLVGDRRGDGHQHPAAQPRRDRRRTRAADREPRYHHR